MTTATARNTDKTQRSKWEVVDYRTRRRIAFADPKTNEEQGQMTKAEAEYLARAVNNTFTRIEAGN